MNYLRIHCNVYNKKWLLYTVTYTRWGIFLSIYLSFIYLSIYQSSIIFLFLGLKADSEFLPGPSLYSPYSHLLLTIVREFSNGFPFMIGLVWWLATCLNKFSTARAATFRSEPTGSVLHFLCWAWFPSCAFCVELCKLSTHIFRGLLSSEARLKPPWFNCRTLPF